MNTIIFRKLWLLVVLIAFTSCQQSIKDIEVTEENRETLFEEIKDSKDLTLGEVQLLQAYVVRTGLQNALSGGEASIPTGKTIGSMIEDQRSWTAEEKNREAEEKARQEKAQAEEERQREQLRGVLSVTVYEKGFTKSNYQKYITLKLRYENTSDKDIRGFKGVVVFNDLFGDLIKRVTLKEDDVLKAKKSRRVSRTIDYNQFIDSDQSLNSKEIDNLAIRWEPDTILFADGESLSIDAPD